MLNRAQLKLMDTDTNGVLRGHGHLVLRGVDVRAGSAPSSIDQSLVGVAGQGARSRPKADGARWTATVAIARILLPVWRNRREGELRLHHSMGVKTCHPTLTAK